MLDLVPLESNQTMNFLTGNLSLSPHRYNVDGFILSQAERSLTVKSMASQQGESYDTPSPPWNGAPA